MTNLSDLHSVLASAAHGLRQHHMETAQLLYHLEAAATLLQKTAPIEETVTVSNKFNVTAKALPAASVMEHLTEVKRLSMMSHPERLALKERTGLASGAIISALKTLVQEGRIRRIGRGIYTIKRELSPAGRAAISKAQKARHAKR